MELPRTQKTVPSVEGTGLRTYLQGQGPCHMEIQIMRKTLLAIGISAALALPATIGAHAASDTVAPGPDPVEGVAEGTVETGKGVVKGGEEVGKGVGKAGGHISRDTKKHGAAGVVTGTAKGAAEVGKGAAKGAVEVGKGVVKGVGCVVTLGSKC